MIEVFHPRYHDRRVLVAKYKVKKGRNIIKITEGSAKGSYEVSEIAIRSYPLESNGIIPVYSLPLDNLRRIV